MFNDRNKHRRRTYNTMAERKGKQGQNMFYKALHRKQKIEQHEPYIGFYAVPAPCVASPCNITLISIQRFRNQIKQLYSLIDIVTY